MKRRLVYGVGINDANYIVKPEINGKTVSCPYYSRWIGMLGRCYSTNRKGKNPTYVECTVTPEWHTFSNFKNWMKKQDWKGKQIDKDILEPGNKIYSPSRCVFVSNELNSFFTDAKAIRGKYKIGVTLNGKSDKKFRARIRIKNKLVNLGYFNTEDAAHNAWRIAKLKQLDLLILDPTNKHIKSGLAKHRKLI